MSSTEDPTPKPEVVAPKKRRRDWRRGVNRSIERMRRVVRRNRPVLILAGLFTVFVVAFFWPLIFVKVHSGEAGVKYKLFGGGTVTDVTYGEGLHAIWPWDRMYVYNVRIQERNHEVELLSKNGLSLKFLISVRYHPERDLVGMLHKRVGPEYVDTIVIPQVVSVLRTRVGQLSAEDVFTTQRAILEDIFSEAIEQLTQNYITVNQVIIRTIELPVAIQEAVQNKIEQRHIAEAYEFRLLAEQKEAQRKGIEAEGLKQYNETVAESLTPEVLKWKGIQATQEISLSPNSKVIVVGNGENGLPIILGGAQ